jgi:transposase-like protein
MEKKRVSRKKQIKREYTPEFKQEVVARMGVCSNISELARELGVGRMRLYEWERVAEGRPRRTEGSNRALEKSPAAMAGEGEAALRGKIRWLEEALANQMAERDFFESALQKVETRRQSSSGSGETASTSKSGS